MMVSLAYWGLPGVVSLTRAAGGWRHYRGRCGLAPGRVAGVEILPDTAYTLGLLGAGLQKRRAMLKLIMLKIANPVAKGACKVTDRIPDPTLEKYHVRHNA